MTKTKFFATLLTSTFLSLSVHAGPPPADSTNPTQNDILMADYIASLGVDFVTDNEQLTRLVQLYDTGQLDAYTAALNVIQPSSQFLNAINSFNATTAVTDLVAKNVLNALIQQGFQTSSQAAIPARSAATAARDEANAARAEATAAQREAERTRAEATAARAEADRLYPIKDEKEREVEKTIEYQKALLKMMAGIQILLDPNSTEEQKSNARTLVSAPEAVKSNSLFPPAAAYQSANDAYSGARSTAMYFENKATTLETTANELATRATNLEARATNLENRAATLEAASGSTPGIGTVNQLRFASFNHLVSQQAHSMGMGVASLFQKASSTQRRRNPADIAAHFTNSPEEINRHPLSSRTKLGDASVWIQPYGQLVSLQNTVNSPGLNSQLAGLVCGADYKIRPNIMVGILGGVSESPYKLHLGRGWGHMNSGYGGLYGGFQDDSGVYVSSQAIFGGNAFKNNRLISFPGVYNVATSTHNAFQFTTNLEVGYTTPVYNDIILQPFLTGDYMLMSEAGYTESGAGALSSFIDRKVSQFLQWDLGAQIYKTFEVHDVLLRPSAELGWMQRRPVGAGAGNIRGGLVNQVPTLQVTGTSKVYNQIAPGVGFLAQFSNGFYISTNILAQCGGGLNIGEGLIRAGYEF